MWDDLAYNSATRGPAGVHPRRSRSGARGVVVLAFTVGRVGRIEHHVITRASGSDVLDAAAVRMLHGATLPSPFGGIFRGQIAIRFQIKP